MYYKMCILLKSYKNYQKIICPLKKKNNKKRMYLTHIMKTVSGTARSRG